MARQPLSLKARAIGLLAQREHSRLELRRKLLTIERRVRAAAASEAAAAAASGVSHGSARAAPCADAAMGGGHVDEQTDIDTDSADSDAVAATVDALLDTLAAGGYLNETRFVESRVHQRARRFGMQRIQQELAQHGLKLDTEQHEALRASELERAREVWLKRFGPEPATEPAEQARQMRFLLARGFSPELVRRLLRNSRAFD